MLNIFIESYLLISWCVSLLENVIFEKLICVLYNKFVSGFLLYL